MANIAFIFTGVNHLAGGGGAERFFSDFFTRYNNSKAEHELFFITDKESLKSFNSIGQLKEKKNRLVYKIVSNRFKNKLEALQVIFLLTVYRIKILQIPLYNIHYYPLIKSIDSLPAFLRPKIVYTITDAFIPHFYNDDAGRGYNFKTTLNGLFQNIKIDAIISWYELFKKFANENKLVKSNPEIYCIQSRYSGKKFDNTKPKKNHIVFASRLTLAKRPMMFVEALRILKEKNAALKDWKFFIYGKGNLELEIQEKLKEYGLTDLVTLSHNSDLTSVFEESKCFVSTQDFENFPSLSMNEALAAGNAIITRKVGQTSLFVKHLKNGLLIEPDNEQGLASSLEYFLLNENLHKTMQSESLRLAYEVHTFENFKSQMNGFWNNILAS